MAESRSRDYSRQEYFSSTRNGGDFNVSAVPHVTFNTSRVSATAPQRLPLKSDSIIASPYESKSLDVSQRELSLMQREAELSRRYLDEAIARERATQRLLTSEANYTRTALNETRFAEQLARDTTRSLAREISHVREDLNASRRSEDATRDALNRSRGEVEILLGETKRLNDQKTMLAEEALSRQRSLSNVAQDVHRQENIIRDKDDHIRHLEHQLANRQRECADLNSQVASLKRQVDEMNMNNGRLQSMSAELEERLVARAEEVRRAQQETDDVKSQINDIEKEARYQINRIQQDNEKLKHDSESMQSIINDREQDIGYSRKRISELEGYINQLRRDVQLRDEKLDHRHGEIQSWTAECDRLRRDLENARSHQIELKREFDEQLKREKLLVHDLRGQMSSIEVEKSIALAAKNDLIQDIARLQRQLDEREDQVRRLTRALEDKDQMLAEAAPLVRESQRQHLGKTTSKSARSSTVTQSRLTLGKSKFRY